MRLQADDRCCMIKTDQRRNSESGIPAQNRSVFIIQSENETADLSQTRWNDGKKRKPERAAAWSHYRSLIHALNRRFFCALKERTPVIPCKAGIQTVYFLRKRALENILECLLRGKQKPEPPAEYQEGPLEFGQKAVTDNKLKNKRTLHAGSIAVY